MNFSQNTLSWQPVLWRETVTSEHTPTFVVCAGILQRMGVLQRRQRRCVNIYDYSSTSGKSFVNFGPITPEILWLICAWVVSARKLQCAVRCFLKIIR